VSAGRQLIEPQEFDAFYAAYSKNVEGFYEAAYWRLCDSIIQAHLRRHLDAAPGERILDAGGGTGRWAAWCHRALGVRVTVADRSHAMLAEAQRRVDGEGLAAAVELVHCDIQTTKALAPGGFVGAISTYNMLSFVDDPAAALATIARALAPGRRALVMGQGFANALSSKFASGASPDELHELAERRVVKWAPHVPPLRVYSAAELRGLMDDAGLEVEAVYGVTSLVHPGPEDFTYPYLRMSATSTALERADMFEAALALELRLGGEPEWADRGVNLLAVGRRVA
jgi:ubiquinone/menaquinone biosynthesis C-methylase UbiE